jgi:hypothetical protein
LKIKTLPVVVALAVLTAGATGWTVWDRTRSGIRSGHAFADGGGSYTIGMTTVRKGHEVWYLAPSLANASDDSLTLETAKPAQSSAGMEYIGARIYKRDAFPGGVPLSWGTADGGSPYSPPRAPSQPFQGFTLEPGQGMDEVVYLHFRVTTDQRPLENNGVTVEYRQKGKRFAQTLSMTFRLENPAQPS